MDHYYIEVKKEDAPEFIRRIEELGLERYISFKQSMWGVRRHAIFVVRDYDHRWLPPDLQEKIVGVRYQP